MNTEQAIATVSLMLAIVLICLVKERKRPERDGLTIIQYPIEFYRWTLFVSMATGLLAIVGLVVSFLHLPLAVLVQFSLPASIVTLIFSFSYVAARISQVEIDAVSLRSCDFTYSKPIDLRSVKAVALTTPSGRGSAGVSLFDAEGKRIARLPGQMSDLFGEIERRTLSQDVMLYRRDLSRNWQERANIGTSAWRSSKGPLYFQRQDRENTIAVIVGLALALALMKLL